MLNLLILFAFSLIAILIIALIISWLYPDPKSDKIVMAEFQQQLNEHGFSNKALELAVSLSGNEAIARLDDNNKLAFLRRLNRKYSLRIVSPEQIKFIKKAKQTMVSINDFTWPAFRIDQDQERLAKNWLQKMKEQ